ncbi:MAG: hypothetical protein K9L02_01000 [Acholeplasmataceae bacterium]|nr:hypothetical protein [Acholeplasmataceae bacterium]
MRKLLTVLVFFVVAFMLFGCTEGEDNNPIDPIKNEIQDPCGQPNYFMINGECVLIENFISDNISIYEDETRVENLDSIELMNEFVADLTDSKGLAVVPRDVYENAINLGGMDYIDMLNLATTATIEDTENLIVKLTEDGFFEEVSFTDSSGQNVEITSNPLALEVYGAYTVVIFEVTYNNNQTQENFAQKVYDSFYAGGIYLIHNLSGKMFSTKDVEQIENTYSFQENHSRYVHLSVTLNEPVIEIQILPQFDEFNNPIVDEFGNMVYEEVSVPVLDNEGNPLIYTEGPILMEEQLVGLIQYFEQQIVDDEGNPVFDEDGKPVFEIVEEPVLDENGNQIFEMQFLPVLDENGNLQYQQQFEVDFFIEDIRDITVIEYTAVVQDNPITKITQRFVDKIISEYFNWNYYRVNNYMISSYGFSAGNEDIYYMDTITEDSVTENFVMKVSFDSETNELTLQKYINATKANFTNCEIILDPRNNNIICDSWDGNIKVYSETHGLKTIPDTDTLQPVTFPNGELYFYDNVQTYVEELGYYTTLLYVINSDGTLTSSYIELGEKDEISTYSYVNGFMISIYDDEPDPYASNQYLYLQNAIGEKIIADGDLSIGSVGSYSSFRPACTDIHGCWYSMQTEILDAEGNLIATLDSSGVYYPGDPVPNYKETYQIDANTTYQYEQVYSDTDAICDNVSGCVSQVNLTDQSINEWGIWMNQNVIVPFGEKFLNTITLGETNSADYEYTKVVTGTVCNYSSCDESVKIRIYDDTGELLSEYYNQMQIPQGETIPLYIEYRMTEDTVITMTPEVCTTSTGCFRYYETYDQVYYWISYQQGDPMYETIDFAETDKQIVTEQTLESAICTNINGCWNNEETVYTVVDEFGTELYHFSQYITVQYGYRKPYHVTVEMADATLDYRKESLSENKTCASTTCGIWVAFSTSAMEYGNLGSGYVVFENGEEIYNQVVLVGATPVSFENELTCTSDLGCIMYTQNYRIVDGEGNEYQQPTETWYNYSLPVRFNKGDKIPIDENFEVTFVLTNVEYRKIRISVYDFLYNLNNVIILDDNTYLIEKQQWVQGNDNYILIYDEVEAKYYAKYTNISAFTEITRFKEGYIAINDDETAIIHFTYDASQSTEDYYYFDVVNLTEGLQINGVNDLVIDYDGSIYFKGVDNFIQDITGSISEDGVVTIDTEFVVYEVIRLRPIN